MTTSSEPEAPPTRAQLTAYLSRMRPEPGRTELHRLFAPTGTPAPRIVWSPEAAELQPPPLRQFHQICSDHADGSGCLDVTTLKLSWFAAISDWLMVIDVLPDGHGFVYRHYGAGIADHFGRDMTGETSDAFGGHISVFFSALYQAAVQRKEPVFSEHEPPQQTFIRQWTRLIVPVTDAAQTVTSFVVVNYPDTELRAGLEIIMDPVFVIDAGQTVHYANTAARDAFSVPGTGGGGATLADLTGITLDTAWTPEEMVGRRLVQEDTRLNMETSVIEDYLVAVGATIYRSRAFYVVTFRTPPR